MIDSLLINRKKYEKNKINFVLMTLIRGKLFEYYFKIPPWSKNIFFFLLHNLFHIFLLANTFLLMHEGYFMRLFFSFFLSFRD